MLAGWLAILVVSVYLAGLLALALWGEHWPGFAANPRWQKAIYLLSSCVYCSAWSFFGSVAVASHSGLDFVPIYLGPILAFGLGQPALIRLIRLAKSQKITSVADFVAARYGKASSVAATTTVIATLASVPYIALQIRAVAQALAVFLDGRLPTPAHTGSSARIVAAALTCVLATFTILIGTRRLDATEHQRGLMLAVAFESVVKLAAFVATGIFVTWGMFGGIGGLTEQFARRPVIAEIIDKPPDPSLWLSLTLVTVATAFFLPRQFHASVVENVNERDVRTAAWFVPGYILALNLFVMPIAVAGLIVFPGTTIDRDFTILALPVHAGNPVIALVVLIGSISAATSMVLVSTTVLAVMISNDLVMPFWLRARSGRLSTRLDTLPILALRRIAIVCILGVSLLFADYASAEALSSVGLLSLATVAQIAPAAIIGLVWPRATARGAIGGCVAGTSVIAYTLFLPTVMAHSSPFITDGPFGIGALKPGDLFGVHLAPLSQALIWSLTINLAAFWILSLSRRPNANEHLQANIFVPARTAPPAPSHPLRPAAISLDDLISGVAQYLDPAIASRLFLEWHETHGVPFDGSREAEEPLIQFAERLVASSIGTASSRMVVSLLLRNREISAEAARRLIDDAAFEIQNSRDVLQHAIDAAQDGMAVYDSDLRLVAWNRAYRNMFQFPADLLRVGTPLDVLVRSNAERGIYGAGPVDEFVAARLEVLTSPTEGRRLYSARSGRIFEMRSVRLPNGGLFFTYTDATTQIASEEELEAENLTLEQRVHDRTEELERVNVELLRAKADAEDANISKSRFLAAASHDLLQPLSAARLYMTSLRERVRSGSDSNAVGALAASADASLEALEEILSALVEISHLDAGATRKDITTFDIGELLAQLRTEFEPMAQARGLRLVFVPSSLRVTSDRKLLRRMLQNLIANAVKYTFDGRVLVGARRAGANVRLCVYDTGIGIPQSKQKVIFREFERLPAAVEAGAGAGLGLSIVDRLSEVLNHAVTLRSTLGRGSAFFVALPWTVAPERGLAVMGTNALRQRSLAGLVVAAIDNEPAILTAMTLLLQGWDCNVARGIGLAEIEGALADLGRAPDVIVADYHIGEIDGLDVITALRGRYGFRPAVLVTADRSPVIRDLAHAADVRLLHKPLKPAALRSLLSQWHLVKAAAE